MSSPTRSLYSLLNLAFGVSIGAAASIWVHQAGAWTDRPSTALVTAGCFAVFGAAHVATVSARGQLPTLRGIVTVAGSAAGVLVIATVAVSAPVWVLVWVTAAVVGVITGLSWPLPARNSGHRG